MRFLLSADSSGQEVVKEDKMLNLLIYMIGFFCGGTTFAIIIMIYGNSTR